MLPDGRPFRWHGGRYLAPLKLCIDPNSAGIVLGCGCRAATRDMHAKRSVQRSYVERHGVADGLGLLPETHLAPGIATLKVCDCARLIQANERVGRLPTILLHAGREIQARGVVRLLRAMIGQLGPEILAVDGRHVAKRHAALDQLEGRYLWDHGRGGDTGAAFGGMAFECRGAGRTTGKGVRWQNAARWAK